MVKLAKNQLCETFGVVQFSTFGRKFALDGLLLPRLGARYRDEPEIGFRRRLVANLWKLLPIDSQL